MFTGIIRGIGKIVKMTVFPGLTRLKIAINQNLLLGVQKGASISIDGTCLTVVDFTESEVDFDVIDESLNKTNLKFLREGDSVNIERAARFGDEIGGHILSGHVYGTVRIKMIDRPKNNCVVTLECPPGWAKYLLPKGYVALNGASLTLVDVDNVNGLFTVHLIPETLVATTFGLKKVGDVINLEIESQTQAIVDTIEKIMHQR